MRKIMRFLGYISVSELLHHHAQYQREQMEKIRGAENREADVYYNNIKASQELWQRWYI